MGIIVQDEYLLENGIALSGYYINILQIQIKKKPTDATRYDVWAEYRMYATKQARLDNKGYVCKMSIYVDTDSLNEIERKVYEEIKKLYSNYEDDE